MDRIKELFGKGLENLTDEEIVDLRSAVIEEGDRLQGEPRTTETVAAIAELGQIASQVMADSQRRAQQAEADEQTVTDAAEAIRALNGEDETPEGGEETPPAEGGEEDEDEDPEGAEAGAEGAPVAVTAGAGRGGSAVERMAGRQGSQRPNPEAAGPMSRAVLTAAAGASGMRVGDPIEDRESFGRMMSEAFHRMRHAGKDQPVIIASALWEYPEDRRLGVDANRNGELMDAVTGRKALLASGGICPPVNVDYDVPTWATADRPIRDGLPSFEATRGGLQYVTPPDIGGFAGATGIWTAATDANPGSATKPLLVLTCGSVVTVDVEAVTTRVQMGNMQNRFAPEQMAAQMDLVLAAQARVAENNLMSLISAASTVVGSVTNTQLLGAARDFVTTLDQARAALVYVHRLPADINLTALVPIWLKDIIRADIAQEIGHDQSEYFDALKIPDSYIDSLFSSRGITPIWHLDGLPAATYGGSSLPLQGFAAQTAGAIKAFPVNMLWWLFPTGTIQFLDGGRLDLGIVRDATLDATNDMETFVETFEGIAPRGFANSILEMDTQLCANGGTAATVSTTGRCL